MILTYMHTQKKDFEMVFEKKLKLKWNLEPELGTYMMTYAKNGQNKISLFSKLRFENSAENKKC